MNPNAQAQPTISIPQSETTVNPHHPAGTPSILVVDDDRPSVSFLPDLLESEGYRVQDAFGGNEAIQILQRTRPHLVISDIEMPHTDGGDILRFINQDSAESVPKIIFMSASGQQAGSAHVPFILKPFDLEDLLELVDEALEGRDPREAVGGPH